MKPNKYLDKLMKFGENFNGKELILGDDKILLRQPAPGLEFYATLTESELKYIYNKAIELGKTLKQQEVLNKP